MGIPLLSEAESLVTPLQGLDPLAIGFKRLLPGQPLSLSLPTLSACVGNHSLTRSPRASH